MILLTEPKILFLKPRKVAGTSFEIALSKFADQNSIMTPISAEDEITRGNLGFRGAQNYFMTPLESFMTFDSSALKDLIRRRRTKKYWNHIPSKLAKQRLGHPVWSQSFKISIVRNPYDMAVSRYFWSKKPTEYSSDDFESFCLSRRDRFQDNLEQYFIDGDEVVDFYIRYESIHQDILILEEKFTELKGLAEFFAQIKAKGQYRPRNASTSEMFSQAPNAKRLIAELCRFEIEKFGYECP